METIIETNPKFKYEIGERVYCNRSMYEGYGIVIYRYNMFIFNSLINYYHILKGNGSQVPAAECEVEGIVAQ